MTPDLQFAVEGAKPVTFAAGPLLAFKLMVRQNAPVVPIHTIVLRCQVRIEPAMRRYDAEEQDRLRDLFDRPERWGQTLRPMLWTHTSAIVPRFTEQVAVDLPVPCTFDFNVAATKYFHALKGDEVPLLFLFSGTVFYEADDGRVQVAQIPWEKESLFRLPVAIWEQMMMHYYPNTAWLCLRRDAFDRLEGFKRRHRLHSWEAAVERLLRSQEPMVAEEAIA